MIDGVVHEEAETDDVLQEILLQIWKEAGVIRQRRAARWAGWSRSHAAAPSTDCAGARPILVRGNVMGRDWCNSPGICVVKRMILLCLNDLHHFLEKRIQVLPRLQREAVKLAFFEGLSHREIAAATHAPLGTVKTRLELGLRKLAHSIRPLRDKV